MNQSSIGRRFVLTTWGESHGKALGAVVDGCPAGLSLCEEDIQGYMDRRSPGKSPFATARKEGDRIQILSGVFEGRTTGTPISMAVFNEDMRSRDYSNIMNIYRPGHADYTFDQKYGFRDYRGGGRSSGRETLCRVAGGAIALRLLADLGIHVTAYTKAIGPVACQDFDESQIANNFLCMPDEQAAKKAEAFLYDCMEKKDSAGGVIEGRITGVPAGLGDPVFGKLDAALAGALMSIGAVKAVEIGDGIQAASSLGSQDNDGFAWEDGRIVKTSNHAGGILGGISDGSDIIFRLYVKPTPSIARPQESVNKNGENISLEIGGRHDPVIVPRAVVVAEAMAGLVIADALLCQASSRMDNLKKLYQKP